jgi:glycosyltransferase involved in cell wall biosynthesis
MNSQLSVAIKIPTFNVQASVQQTLKSLLNQTYKNFIIYIYDNCSTDSTLEIIRDFNDPRIVITVADENHGWKWNFDRCLKSEGPPLTLFAHADDIYHPNFLEINITVLNKYEALSLIFSNGSNFSDINDISSNFYERRKPLSVRMYASYTELLKELAIRGNFIFCPSAFGRSEIFYSVIHEFREAEFGGSADLDAWLRVAKNHSIAIIESPILFYYRISSNQISEHDRGLDTGSVFVKCMNEHLRSVQLDMGSYHKEVAYLIRWHELFHAIVSNLKQSISSEKKCIDNRFAHNVSELMKLRGISMKRNVLLISLLLLVEVAALLPNPLRSRLVKIILGYSR